jgi:hypothetical protein|tara:strand:+ start:106 stop:435 length:330 start_codon:yes stop_codon:yes gene_type:complete
MSGGITRIAPESIIGELTNWSIEAGSGYNDGWTRQHYQNQLDRIFSHIDKMRMSKEEREIEEERVKWICDECGKSTFETDYDYLVSPTMHLGCQLKLEEGMTEEDKLTI